MHPIRRVSLVDQTAEHLRDCIRAGIWRSELPGVLRLAEECDVSKDAMRAALRLLEKEGLLSACRAGARRTVIEDHAAVPARGVRAKSRSLRVAILLYRPLEDERGRSRLALSQIQREIEAAGHVVAYAPKTQSALRFDPARIAKLVAATPADAWIVVAAPREVLDFFAAQPLPVIAFRGRYLEAGIAGAGADGTPAICAATQRLLTLGHRRIVMICPREYRQPAGGGIVTGFAAELAAHGITAGDYHLPDFEPTAAGLRALYEALFRVTPPTALLIECAEHMVAAIAWLAQRGLSAPRDVSLVCLSPDVSLQWCDPPVARIVWPEDRVVRRVVHWCRAIARGQEDREPVLVPAEFDEGGTIGPVRS